MLLDGVVDAVVVTAAKEDDDLAPAPLLARTPEEVLRGRGVKPSLSPVGLCLRYSHAKASFYLDLKHSLAPHHNPCS